MTDDELLTIEALADAATMGPWQERYRPGSAGYDVARRGSTALVGSLPMLKQDAAFIAAARTAVPALIAEVRRLRDLELSRNRDENFRGSTMTTWDIMHGRKIKLISWPNTDGGEVGTLSVPSSYGDEMSFTMENLGDHGAAWVSVVKGGVEVARHNARYIEAIVWAD